MFRISLSPKALVSPLALCLLASCLIAPDRVAAQQVINGCQVFPADNIWNRKIDSLSPDTNSDTYVNSLGRTTRFHPDWGANPAYGIPYNLVPPDAKFAACTFEYADESDVGPYPVNRRQLIEGGTWTRRNRGDRHVLMLDYTNKKLYELYSTYPRGKKFNCGSGAIYNLNSNMLRPNGWTSADAAGLAVFPGVLNYDEVLSGAVKHALRCTCLRTNGYIWPARHKAGTQTLGYPPMGQRFRLKAGFNISGFSATNQVILTCLKQYGMMVADNGSNWYVQGAPDKRWNDDDLNQLKTLTGNDFEAIDQSGLMVNPDSGQAN